MNIRCARVLVIEDEALVGMLLEDMLQDIGCGAIELVPRFAEGLEAAEHGDFDLAILDVNLDGVSSFPIAERLLARNIPLGLRHRLWLARYGSLLRPGSDAPEAILFQRS